MAIPLDTIVDVNVAIAPTPLALAGFGQLLFISPEANTVLGAEHVRTYVNMEGVAADFPTGEVNKAATAYYAQTPKPSKFMVGGVIGSDTPATILGGTHDTLANIQAITDGTIVVEVNGVETTASSLDFSGAASLDDVAPILEASLSGTTVTYNVGDSRFEVATIAVGSDSASIGRLSGVFIPKFHLFAALGEGLVRVFVVDWMFACPLACD